MYDGIIQFQSYIHTHAYTPVVSLLGLLHPLLVLLHKILVGERDTVHALEKTRVHFVCIGICMFR
jgi:hypothetical protein